MKTPQAKVVETPTAVGSNDDPRSLPEIFVDWVKRNTLWALGLSPLVLAAVQLLIVSRGDPATLRVLVQAADPVKVILGSALPLFPVFLTYFAPYYVERRIRGESVPSWWFWASISITALAVFTLPSAWFSGYVIIWTMMAGVLLEWIIRRRGGKSVRVYQPIMWLFAILIVAAGASGPWLALEVIKVKGEGPIVASVVRQEGDWTTLLRHGGGIKLVRSADLVSRTVCNYRIPGQSAIGKMLSWPEGNPRCEDLVKKGSK